MSAHWFLVDAVGAAGAFVQLPRDEARHAGGARRLRDGDVVSVFDGAGTVGHGRLADRGSAVVIDRVEHVSPPVPVEIASAVPKGDRMATLLDMATQLGMTAFTPLVTRRSVVADDVVEKALRRWQRVCVEACKQSHRAWLPTLRLEPISPAAAIADAVDRRLLPVIADRDGGTVEEARRARLDAAGIRFLIGPEGGFDRDEMESIGTAGASAVCLSAHVLRIETAVVAACASVAPPPQGARDPSPTEIDP